WSQVAAAAPRRGLQRRGLFRRSRCLLRPIEDLLGRRVRARGRLAVGLAVAVAGVGVAWAGVGEVAEGGLGPLGALNRLLVEGALGRDDVLVELGGLLSERGLDDGQDGVGDGSDFAIDERALGLPVDVGRGG